MYRVFFHVGLERMYCDLEAPNTVLAQVRALERYPLAILAGVLAIPPPFSLGTVTIDGVPVDPRPVADVVKVDFKSRKRV